MFLLGHFLAFAPERVQVSTPQCMLVEACGAGNRQKNLGRQMVLVPPPNQIKFHMKSAMCKKFCCSGVHFSNFPKARIPLFTEK